MASLADAKRVISDIRKDLDADNPEDDVKTKTLANAMEVVSSDIYSAPEHFILEMVQNADDNQYDSAIEPRLSLAYRDDGYLWIACNEAGFTERDVRAICTVKQSTKKDHRDSIGEKGIGFKSVFKVASVVWISSGPFSFHFDRDAPIGTLIPVWSEFKATTMISAWKTMFCLRIPKQRDRLAVKKGLRNLEAEVLLFLRKLRCITVVMSRTEGGEPYYSTVLRAKPSPLVEGIETVHLTRSELQKEAVVEEVIVCRTGASTLPSDGRPPNRDHQDSLSFSGEESDAEQVEKDTDNSDPNGSSTPHQPDVRIAFPTSGNRGSRKTYNFLPIRDYGFPFILHASFALSANREEMSTSAPINRALRLAAIGLFVQSVKKFNSTGHMKYRWPQFARSASDAPGTFMEGFFKDLQHQLRKERVLVTQSGNLRAPSALLFVPTLFCDGGSPRRPLTGSPNQLGHFVSVDYHSFGDLQVLGVRKQTGEDFRRRLGTMSLAWIHNQPESWHSRLAAAINNIGCSKFREVPIIPLRDGTWISATATPFYFPTLSSNEFIPEGIEVKIIDDNACEDRERWNMFKAFGAKELSSAQVCQLILAQHEFENWPSPPSSEMLVAQTWYLFEWARGRHNLDTLKVMAQDSEPLLSGDEVYMDDPSGSFLMSEYFPSKQAPCNFLNARYLDHGSASERPHWIKWLRKDVKVRTLPRLLAREWFGSVYLASEFQHLIAKHHCRVWLGLLKDNWETYSKDAIGSKDLVGALEVECKEESCELHSAYVATSAVMEVALAAEYLDTLDIDDPNAPEWRNLSCLGLRLEPDLNLYLHLLQQVAGSSLDEVSKKDLDQLYRGIEHYFSQDAAAVRTAFLEGKLIAVPRPKRKSGRKWCSLAICRWEVPVLLERFVALSGAMAKFASLFREHLNVQSFGPMDVLDELLGLDDPMEGYDHVKQLLLLLGQSIQPKAPGGHPGDSRLEEGLLKLAQRKIFPARKDRCLLRSSDEYWFITDSSRHMTWFDGKVWTLDFLPEQLNALHPLLVRMDLWDRCLSKNIQQKIDMEGDQACHSEHTAIFRGKARFISLLVPDAEQEIAFARLEDTEIWSAQNLVIRRYVIVNGNGKKIYGKRDKGWSCMDEAEDRTRLYLSLEDARRKPLPWHLLSDSLAEVLNVPIDKRATLISILMASETREIEYLLDAANVDPDKFCPVEMSDLSLTANSDSPGENEDILQHAEHLHNTPNHGLRASGAKRIASYRHERSPSIFKSPSPASRRSPRYQSLGREPEVASIEELKEAARKWKAGNVSFRAGSESPVSQNQGRSSKLSEALLTPSRIGKRISRGSGRNSPSPSSIPRFSADQNPFDLREIGEALPSISGRRVPTPEPTQRDGNSDYQQDIGYAGEVVVYEFLKSKLDAAEECWTSRYREPCGLEEFRGSEGDFSDFTLSKPEEVDGFTEWLVESGIGQAREWGDGVSTYHLEVKTTEGPCSSPFFMSGNQLRLAQEWHASHSDVYVILRVYNIRLAAQLQVYVDPHARKLDGSLLFIPKDGYYVTPA